MTLVSIIIPCYNEENTISWLLEALEQQTYPQSSIEIILADGMSIDKTREIVTAFAQNHPQMRIRLIDNPQKSIPAALNNAIEASTGEYIVRLDAHSIPNANYVEKCINHLKNQQGDNVGGVWEIQPGDSSWLAESIAAAAAHPMGVGDAHYRYSNTAGYVDTVPFGSYKKDLFVKIGGFDENLLTNEDYELNARIRSNGGKIWLDPAIRAIYFARSSLGALAKQYWRYGFWKWRMVRRYPSTIRWRQALPPLFVLSLLGLGLFSCIPLPPSNFWQFVQTSTRWLFSMEILLYFTVLLAGCLLTARRKNNILLGFGMPLAIFTMHVFWGSGFLWSMLTSVFKTPPPPTIKKIYQSSSFPTQSSSTHSEETA